MGEGDDYTGRGAASAPQCAGLPSCGRWCNGALPEPPGGLSFDGLPVECHGGSTLNAWAAGYARAINNSGTRVTV